MSAKNAGQATRTFLLTCFATRALQILKTHYKLLERFPSLSRWQSEWESKEDIFSLREKKGYFERLEKLCREKSAREQTSFFIEPPPTYDSVEPATAALRLPNDVTARLIEDAKLIIRWYHLSEFRFYLALGAETTIASLPSLAEKAKNLYEALSTNIAQIDALIASDPDPSSGTSYDLFSLWTDLGQFAVEARAAHERLRHRGRKPDARRNVAIALATQAIEEATGQCVRITKDVSRHTSWRFTTPPGQFVVNLLRLLGHEDERVLVAAFDRLRRRQKVKQ